MTRDEFLAIDPTVYVQEGNHKNRLSDEEITSLAPEVDKFIEQFKMNKSEDDSTIEHFEQVYLSYAPIVRLEIWTRIARDPNGLELMRRAHRIMCWDIVNMLTPHVERLMKLPFPPPAP